MELNRWLVWGASRLKTYLEFIRGFLHGMTVHEIELQLKKDRAQLDNLLMLYAFGDLLGLPLLPPYYSLRLIPYFLPSLEIWKRRLLREKDLSDLASTDI